MNHFPREYSFLHMQECALSAHAHFRTLSLTHTHTLHAFGPFFWDRDA